MVESNDKLTPGEKWKRYVERQRKNNKARSDSLKQKGFVRLTLWVPRAKRDAARKAAMEVAKV